MALPWVALVYAVTLSLAVAPEYLLFKSMEVVQSFFTVCILAAVNSRLRTESLRVEGKTSGMTMFCVLNAHVHSRCFQVSAEHLRGTSTKVLKTALQRRNGPFPHRGEGRLKQGVCSWEVVDLELKPGSLTARTHRPSSAQRSVIVPT